MFSPRHFTHEKNCSSEKAVTAGHTTGHRRSQTSHLHLIPKPWPPSSPHLRSLDAPATTLLFQAHNSLQGASHQSLLSPTFLPSGLSLAFLLGIRKRNLGSGNCIPLSLIKMHICTVNEEGNLEADSPVSRDSHQYLSLPSR